MLFLVELSGNRDTKPDKLSKCSMIIVHIYNKSGVLGIFIIAHIYSCKLFKILINNNNINNKIKMHVYKVSELFKLYIYIFVYTYIYVHCVQRSK